MWAWLGLSALFCIGTVCERKRGRRTAFWGAWFDGILLALLCFHMVPLGFTVKSYGAGLLFLLLGLGMGLFVGDALEMALGKWLHTTGFCFAVALSFLGEWPGWMGAALLCGAGSFLLVIASGGILPPDAPVREKQLRAISGILGFLIGILLLH